MKSEVSDCHRGAQPGEQVEAEQQGKNLRLPYNVYRPCNRNHYYEAHTLRTHTHTECTGTYYTSYLNFEALQAIY